MAIQVILWVGMTIIPIRCDCSRTSVRIATTSCLQAWRADTTSAGVEGPGSMTP
jgi:hypothetical protein